jgi:hypothetical protein
VANHPPLFYAVTALPLGLGERVGAPRAGFVAARLLSATLAAGGLVMVALLALLLVPGRPRVAVGAAWLAALLPGLPHVSAFVYNDGWDSWPPAPPWSRPSRSSAAARPPRAWPG